MIFISALVKSMTRRKGGRFLGLWHKKKIKAEEWDGIMSPVKAVMSLNHWIKSKVRIEREWRCWCACVIGETMGWGHTDQRLSGFHHGHSDSIDGDIEFFEVRHSWDVSLLILPLHWEPRTCTVHDVECCVSLFNPFNHHHFYQNTALGLQQVMTKAHSLPVLFLQLRASV